MQEDLWCESDTETVSRFRYEPMNDLGVSVYLQWEYMAIGSRVTSFVFISPRGNASLELLVPTKIFVRAYPSPCQLCSDSICVE